MSMTEACSGCGEKDNDNSNTMDLLENLFCVATTPTELILCGSPKKHDDTPGWENVKDLPESKPPGEARRRKPETNGDCVHRPDLV